MQAQHLVLDRTGDKMPLCGLGIWKIPNELCAQAVYDAIKIGYRLIDSASDYGNEKEAGEGINRAIKDGLVKREDLFIVSKLWNDKHRPEHVELACKKTLSDFGLDYLDLYLIHFPISIKYVPIEQKYPPSWTHPDHGDKMIPDHEVTYESTWHAMEGLVEKKLTRNIGFSNIGCVKIVDVLKYCKIKPSVLQVELHPFLAQEKLVRFTQEAGIQIMAYSSFGSLSYLELGMTTAEHTCLLAPCILDAGKKYNKTPAQIVLRWAVQRKTIIIPKSSKPERLVENMSVFDFELTQDEMNAITALNKNERYNDPGNYAEKAFGCFYPIFD